MSHFLSIVLTLICLFVLIPSCWFEKVAFVRSGFARKSVEEEEEEERDNTLLQEKTRVVFVSLEQI